MSDENPRRQLDGAYPAWTGHVRSFYGAITPSDSTVYDPPLRVLRVGTGGSLVLVYDADDPTVSANRDTQTVTSGQELTYYAIRQVRATGTTASGIKGFL